MPEASARGTCRGVAGKYRVRTPRALEGVQNNVLYAYRLMMVVEKKWTHRQQCWYWLTVVIRDRCFAESFHTLFLLVWALCSVHSVCVCFEFRPLALWCGDAQFSQFASSNCAGAGLAAEIIDERADKYADQMTRDRRQRHRRMCASISEICRDAHRDSSRARVVFERRMHAAAVRCVAFATLCDATSQIYTTV